MAYVIHRGYWFQNGFERFYEALKTRRPLLCYDAKHDRYFVSDYRKIGLVRWNVKTFFRKHGILFMDPDDVLNRDVHEKRLKAPGRFLSVELYRREWFEKIRKAWRIYAGNSNYYSYYARRLSAGWNHAEDLTASKWESGNEKY